MRQVAFEALLDIFDEGLRLYRREFISFVVLAAGWLVPIAIGMGLSIAAMQFWDSTAVLLMIFGWMLLALPLSLYLLITLSRVTVAVQQNHRLNLRETLWVPPLRFVGMGCYGLMFLMIVNMALSALSLFCLCPLQTMLSAVFSSIGLAMNEAGSIGTSVLIALSIILSIIFVIFYIFSMVLSGATYSSLVYALQPFIQHPHVGFGRSIDLSLKLVEYRMPGNMIAFLLASALFGATSLAVTVAIGVIGPLPLLLTLGENSPVAQGVSASAWLIGLVLVLPPMPIWMTLLYQRNIAAYEGHELAAQVETVAAGVED